MNKATSMENKLSALGAAARIANRRVDEASDEIDSLIPVAHAVADALKVLTALDRTTSHQEANGMTTGDGFAAGDAVDDDTMPRLADHLSRLLEQIHANVKVLREVIPLSAPDSA